MIKDETKNPRHLSRVSMRDCWYLSRCDPGATRTHDQWFSQPKMLLINIQMGLQYLILRYTHL